MQKFVQKRRWVLLAAGAAIQLAVGIPSAFGAFFGPLREGYEISETAGTLVFACVIGFFGLGCVLGGALRDRKGPRPAALLGSGLLGGGFGLLALLPAGSPALLILGFSAPVGLGCAFLTPAVLTAAQRWYPDRRGLATGVIGLGMGLSGAALSLLARLLLPALGVRGGFAALGGLLALVAAAGSLFLCDPPGEQTAPPKDQQPALQVVKSRPFLLVFAATALAAPSVLLFSPLIVELAAERGLAENLAFAAVAIGSAGSAAGRLAAPALSDRLPRRGVDMGLFAALCGLSIGFAFAGGWLVLLLWAALTFCYAGQAALLPTLAVDLFGPDSAGRNYGLLALGMSAGSVGFTLLAAALGGAPVRHLVAAVCAGVGFLALLALGKDGGGKGQNGPKQG